MDAIGCIRSKIEAKIENNEFNPGLFIFFQIKNSINCIKIKENIKIYAQILSSPSIN
jgi:hypothetical protein